MAAAGLVDPTKAGRYPVVLSDALLGKKQGDIYTAVRYNHKPDAPPEQAKLRQNTSKAYDLSYTEDGSKFFKYRGNRTSGDNKYVLIFDPRKEVFVLHLVDSTFNLNLVQTPDNKDADSLKREYPHLKNSDTKAPASRGKAASQNKPGKQAKEQAKPAAPPKRKPAASDEEDESSDDDGLEIEFPGGQEPTANRDFSPAFPPRRFSDFVAEADEEEDDADGEDDDDDMSEEHFKLPSPMNAQTTTTATINQAPVPQPLSKGQEISLTFDPDSDESEEDEDPAPPLPAQPEPEQDDDMDIDLERELEDELGAALGAQSDAESDVSEED